MHCIIADSVNFINLTHFTANALDLTIIGVMTIQALPYVSLLGFLFGSTLIASRFSVGQYHPTTYIGLRLIIATVAHVLGYALIHNRQWSRNGRLWRHAMLLGVVGTAVPMTAIVSSLQYLSSGLASMLLTLNPALIVIMAHFFLQGEKITTRKIVGVSLALSGAALLALNGESGLPDVSQADSRGYLLMLVALVTGSVMTVYARKYMSDMDAYDVASIRMVAAAIAVMPLSIWFVGLDLQAVTGQGYFALGYAALVGTFSGLMLAFYITKRFGATPAAMTSYVIPVVATVGGVLVLGEQITAVMFIGMSLIILGIALINQRT